MKRQLVAQQLKYFYSSRTCDGVNKITFSLELGQHMAITGPSGSGKTTLLKLLSGQLASQEGTLNTQDYSIYSYLPHEQTNAVQERQQTLTELFSQQTEKLRDLAQQLELTDYLDTPFHELSTGQQQRYHLAAYFTHNADLLILDEPFNHLDPSMRRWLLDQLLKFAKENNQSVLWSTHFLEDTLCYADKIMLLNFGEMQQYDSPQLIYEKPYNHFVASFFGPCNHEVKEATIAIFRPEHLQLRPPENQEYLTKHLTYKSSQYYGSYILHCFHEQGHLVYYSCPTHLDQNDWQEDASYVFYLCKKHVSILGEYFIL
jgi:ABC-type multidrug transport system ATPase subunit